MRENKPNFLIIGAEKAGTTALYEYLRRHPQVCMSAIKEPNFFSTDVEPKEDQAFLLNPEPSVISNPEGAFKHLAYIRDPNLYRLLFSKCGEVVAIGEASTSYLYSETAALNIYNYNKEMKIVAILRNPLSRMISAYKMEVGIGRIREPLPKAISLYPELLKRSLYSRQIKRYVDLFPSTNILVLIYEDFVKDNQTTLARLFSFLGVNPEPAFEMVPKRVNQALYPKSLALNFILHKTGLKRLASKLTPDRVKTFLKGLYYSQKPTYQIELPPETQRYIATLFFEDIGNLEEIINLDLSLWKKQISSALPHSKQ